MALFNTWSRTLSLIPFKVRGEIKAKPAKSREPESVREM
jgi:hypothetical protein